MDRALRIETSPKRVRAYLNGQLVVDTLAPRLVWEWPHYPTYYLPVGDVSAELVSTGRTEQMSGRGDGDVCDVRVAGRSAAGAAIRFPTSPLPELRDLIRFDWAAMDEWLEEDEPVYTHPRDPYKRVDILASSRRVLIAVDGTAVAASGQPRILFETGLPPRYYLPLPDVRLDLLRPSSSRSHCPYKGTATYWSVQVNGTVHEDLAWTYRAPLPESQKIAGLICFYNEKVDVSLDGVQQERPRSPFS